jgi:hypothetical protein
LNVDFLKKAPAKVVEKQRVKLDGLDGKRAGIGNGLERMRALARGTNLAGEGERQ